MGTGYGQVFTVPFGYCDEGPLVIEGLPAECTFAQGWRNYLSENAEPFLLEPLDVVLFTIDELIAEGLPIAPEDAQVLRAVELRVGYLAGALHTASGEVGFYGTVQCLTDATGTWSFWFVQGVLSSEEVWDIRALSCGIAGAFLDPQVAPCYRALDLCMAAARNTYDAAVRAAKRAHSLCLASAIGPIVLSELQALKWCMGTGPLVVWCLWGAGLLHLGFALGGLIACDDELKQDLDMARFKRDVSEAGCRSRFQSCIASRGLVPPALPGPDASPTHAIEP